MSLKDKVVVITGAGGALGLHLVKAAAADGAIVVGLNRSSVDAKNLPKNVSIKDDVDLAEFSDAKAAFDAIASEHGRIDALVNAAGGFAMEALEEGDTETWARQYTMNMQTALNACKAALPLLIAAPAGRIVNVGALGALSAGASMGPYAASKTAVHKLTESLAAEHKAGSLRVNAVLPSTLNTAANRDAMPDADATKWVSLDELASVIFFLCGEQASAVTGALIPVAGRV